MIDVKALTEAIFKQVHAYVSPALATLQGQFKEFDAKIAAIPAGAPGKDADPAVIRAEVERAVSAIPVPRDGRDADPELVKAEVERAVSALPKPKDGASVTLADVAPLIEAEVAKRVAQIPIPENGKDADPAAIIRAAKEAVDALPRPADGKSVTLDDVAPLLKILVAEAVAALPAARDGKDADPQVLRAMVEEAVAAIPRPQDGKSVGVDDVLPALEELVAKSVSALPVPKDGKDADPAVISKMVKDEVDSLPKPRDGRDVEPEAIRAMVRDAVSEIPAPQDGKSVTLDDVRPFLEAETARWQLEFERRATDVLQRAVEGIPKPKDGRDALSVEDFEVTLEGRVFTFALRCGENVVKREIKVPFPLDRGTYRSGESYEKGDVVTYGGSQWIAKKDTNESPPSDAWRLCVKKGKDGKGSA